MARARRGGRAPALPPERARRGGRAPALPPERARETGDEPPPTSEAPVKERSAVCEHVRLEASRAVFFMRVSTDAEHRDGATRPSRVRDSVRQVRGESRAPRRTSHVQTRRSPRRPLGRGAHHDGRDGACWVAARTTTVATAPAGSRRATTTERRGLMRVSTDPEPRSAGWVGHEALPPSIAHEGVLDQEVVREEDGEEQGEHERAVAERVDPVRAVRV